MNLADRLLRCGIERQFQRRAAACAAALGLFTFPATLADPRSLESVRPKPPFNTSSLQVADEPLSLTMEQAPDLTIEAAREANAALSVSADPLERAPPFRWAVSSADPLFQESLECLAAAVHYEANGEKIEGQRAVAQVVLNRVRHPAFPTSICEVVYQGSDRSSGCQFTFTCDGSLTRRPRKSAWAQAQRVAREALQGHVQENVGMATHYHADWVYPYWAPKLKKINVVGAHIFYGWSGSWGRRNAFYQKPSTSAFSPPADEANQEVPRLEMQTSGSERELLAVDKKAPSLLADDIQMAADGSASAPYKTSAPPALREDQESGVLLVDAPTLP